MTQRNHKQAAAILVLILATWTIAVSSGTAPELTLPTPAPIRRTR